MSAVDAMVGSSRTLEPTPSLPSVGSIRGIGNDELKQDQANGHESRADPVDSLVCDDHCVGWDEKERCNGDSECECSHGPKTCFPSIPKGKRSGSRTGLG
jgi:hypothetical protein